MAGYRTLTQDEVRTMEGSGCSAADWSKVRVGEGFDARRVRRVRFAGAVTIGALDGEVTLDGVALPAELADATLVDCELGDNVRVAQVRSHLANYRVGSGAVVADVGRMAVRPGATFGNGVALEAVNEGGGREVRIFNEMSSQFAYLMCMHRYRTEVVKRLGEMVDACVGGVASDVGTVGAGAVVAHVGEVVDVNVGPCAVLSGAASLKNGTVLSEAAAPTRIGAGVVAEDFIVAEGSTVESGAVLSHAFIGQGVQVGKGFSGENSLFFANSECFHGEACSVFGGPYTVTHHKGTLLIAALVSFYNAGSSTNQSNHMYKLGPVHQGVLERGSKTGSSSYLIWPGAVGPFSVVIGKHMKNFDTRDLPFSYITEEGGESFVTPGMNLTTVGTVRDGEKWPARDRRKGSVKRDQIRFEVFSPYTVGRMVRGEAALKALYEEASRDVEVVRFKGAAVKRLMLRHGARSYASAIDMYLNGKVLERAEPALAQGMEAVRAALAPVAGGLYSEAWADVGGLLIAEARLEAIAGEICSGKIATAADLQAAFEAAHAAYPADEWAWVREAFEARTGKAVDALTVEEIGGVKAAHAKARATFVKKVLADAEKEFDEGSRLGYGADGDRAAADADFEAVRGSFAGNSFVKQMQEALEE